MKPATVVKGSFRQLGVTQPAAKLNTPALSEIDLTSWKFSDLIDAYLKHAKVSLVQSTFNRSKRYLKEFLAVVGNVKVSALKQIHLMEWIENHETWKKVASKAHACNSIRACFGWAIKMGLLFRDPFKGLRYVSRDTRQPITSEQHETLLARTKDENFCDLLRFLWESGMRPDEVCRLEWGHVRFDIGLIAMQQHKTARRTGVVRRVPLTPPIIAILQRAKERNQQSDVVFLTQNKTRWKVSNNLGLKFRRARQRAKLPATVTLYSYRHATATRLLASGTPDRIAGEILGHVDGRMLARYVHPTTTHCREALEKASAFRLSNNVPSANNSNGKESA